MKLVQLIITRQSLAINLAPFVHLVQFAILPSTRVMQVMNSLASLVFLVLVKLTRIPLAITPASTVLQEQSVILRVIFATLAFIEVAWTVFDAQIRRSRMPLVTKYVTIVLQEQSVNGLVSALNTLGIGSFFTYTSGGNTYISNYDNQYVFGVINIFQQGIPQFIYNVDMIGAGGNITIDVNFINQLTLNSPVAQSGTITTASGDYIILGGTTSNSLTQVVTLQNITTGSSYYLGVISPSSPFGTALFPTADSTYVFTMKDN